MLGVDKEGGQVVIGSKPTRMDARSPGLDELTGLGPEAERDGAIVALFHQSEWSHARLARLFDISERQVFRVLRDFEEFMGGADR
jgi:hypothetical protein